MTFAVLPFQAPAGDEEAAQVATGMSEAAFAMQERRANWALVVPRRSVEEALTRRSGTRDLAGVVDVHFQIRVNVTRVASDYNVESPAVDGATERVLGTRSLTVAGGALTPRQRRDLDFALGGLTFQALTAEVERARG